MRAVLIAIPALIICWHGGAFGVPLAIAMAALLTDSIDRYFA